MAVDVADDHIGAFRACPGHLIHGRVDVGAVNNPVAATQAVAFLCHQRLEEPAQSVSDALTSLCRCLGLAVVSSLAELNGAVRDVGEADGGYESAVVADEERVGDAVRFDASPASRSVIL